MLHEMGAGTVLLLVNLWFGAFTLNAWRPIRTPPFAMVSFFAGWLTCELALHHLVFQVALGLILVSEGALGDTNGLVGLGVGVVSWAGLARLHTRGRLVGVNADRVFGELAFTPESARPVRMRAVARPFRMHHRDVLPVESEVYAEVDGVKLSVDVYRRGDVTADAPVLVFLHGGAWVLGFKQYQALPLMQRLASRGWVCMSFDYRLSPRATFPDPLVDAKRAIAWAKDNAPRFGGDPSFVVISGNSAGAHLASLAALTWDDPSYQPGFEDRDTSVAACVSLYGVYDLMNLHEQWPRDWLGPFLARLVIKESRANRPDLYEANSPLTHVRADAPPFFIVHGEKDTVVPVSEGRYFSAALREVSKAPVGYLEIPDGQHAFEIFRSVRGHYTHRAVQRFLENIHGERRPLAHRSIDDAGTEGAGGTPRLDPPE